MKQIQIEYISTKEMIADSLTKLLQGALLNALNDNIMGRMVSTSDLKRQQGCISKTIVPGIGTTQAKNQYSSTHATAAQEKEITMWKTAIQKETKGIGWHEHKK
jgi:hypothetical protein